MKLVLAGMINDGRMKGGNDSHENGIRRWMTQHEYLEKLNLQAHQNARTNTDEFVLEYLISYDKARISNVLSLFMVSF
jgi:hypothetical protein